MNCHRAQPVLSARMDGEAVPRAAIASAEAHAAGCASCTSFAERSGRIRTAVRIGPAMQVPDLVDPIMAAVSAERMAPGTTTRPAHAPRARRPGTWHGVAAALAAGIVVGSVAVGGPWRAADERTVAIATIVDNVHAAAASLRSYSATYAIVERGGSPAIVERGGSPTIAERRFELDVAFLHPQRFRVDVRDLTDYRSVGPPTPTAFTYIEDAPASYREESCRIPDTPCSITSTGEVESRPFSGAAPPAGDLIVPLATFGTTDGIRVVGTAPLDGRDAVHVVLSFERAAPLFRFLEVGDAWRPFYADDRVDLWLDASTWFPLRSTVTPSPAPARRAWEGRFGLPVERPDTPILEVDAISVRDDPPDPSLFEIPDLRDPTVERASLGGRLGYTPATPIETGGLSFVAASTPGLADGGAPRSLLVYARGLDYLKIAEHPDWRRPGPFGPVAHDAERIALGDGVARFAPAGEDFGNLVAIHAADTDLYLESNLPRDELLAIAASLPVRGLPLRGAAR
jgi:hypothetical protein